MEQASPMNIPPPQVKNLENISNHLRTVVKDPKISQTVFQSMDGVIRTLTALLDENGKPGWTFKALNDKDQPIFNQNEGRQFEEKLQPFIPIILKFFDKTPNIKGGAQLTRDKLTELQSKMGKLRNDFSTEPTQQIKDEYTTLYNELSQAVKAMQTDGTDHGIQQQAQNFMKDSPDPSTMIVPPTPQPAATSTSSGQTVNQLEKEVATLKAEKTSLEKQLKSAGVSTDRNFSLDRTVLDTMKKIYKMDEATQKFATENFGILKFEHEYDMGEKSTPDPHPFEILRPVPYVGPFLAEIPVPARLLVMIVYTIIDISRVMVSVSSVDSPFIRSLLSVLLAMADFLKGSWKKAILSFAGVFGQNYVLAGVIGKLFLDVVSLIGPDLQLKIVMGSIDLIKSLVAGVLLQIYQITALAPMRQGIIEAFQEIADLVESNREKLGTALSLSSDDDSLPNFLIPSFTNIQNIQAVVAHDALVCTTQFQNAIDKMLTDAQGNKNAIMRFILEFLLRVPIDPAVRRVRCPGMPDVTKTSGEINVDKPFDPTTQQTYSQTAVKAAEEFSGKK